MLSNKRGILLLALLLVITGCVVVKELPIYLKRPIKYSHVTHVVEEKWECEDCHRGALTEDKAGMPNPRICRKCHETQEEIEEYLYPFAPGNKLMWTNVTDIKDDAVFSHEEHSEVDCEDCHENILKSEEVSRMLKVEKDECIVCHAEESISGDCGVCHKTINTEWEPENHNRSWERFHGQVFRTEIGPPYENRCSLCHNDSECISCHRDEKPRDHNMNWRERGHGIAASMDRDRCAVCHQSYSCDNCHKETRPRNHTGAWGNSRNRHCMACHIPLRGQRCYTCHTETPSHMSAPLLPSDLSHTASTTDGCRKCHMELKTMRHLEKGDDCRTCHH